MKYLFILLLSISGYANSDSDCIPPSQAEIILKTAEIAYEAKYKFESHIEMLNLYGIVRDKLDPIHNTQLIHSLDRLSNSMMGLIQSSLKFVEDYESNFRSDLERVLHLHYSIREKYESVEGDEELNSLSKAVGYNNALKLRTQ